VRRSFSLYRNSRFGKNKLKIKAGAGDGKMLLRKKNTRFSLGAILICLITGSLFMAMTWIRNEEPFKTMDRKWSLTLYDSSRKPHPIMLIITRLGSGFFTIPLGLMLFFSYKNTGHRSKSRLLLFNVLGIRVLNMVFKQLFKRTAPEWERHIEASKYGYPSAHTMNAAGFYGVLLFLSGLWKNIWAVCGCFVFLTMIGVSRVRLGIHFILDMLAGLMGGIFFNVLGIKIYEVIGKR
jgi:membrane-associated phospholipid phosphatase